MSIANMGAEIFPPVDRVVYAKAPLTKVICQVRFPADLRLKVVAPADYQQRIRDGFPILSNTQTESIVSKLPPEIAKMLEVLAPSTATTTTWAFNTENERQTLELSIDKLTLVSHEYNRWEDFFETFQTPFRVLLDLYNPPFFTRIGLRFRDVIRRSAIGQKDVAWSELLRPYILGELAEKEIEQRTQEAARFLVLSLPERAAKVRMRHGFVEVDENKEQAYMIDCDFFVERTEIKHALDTLQYLHDNAFRCFRWCITDRLHQSMAPQSI